MASSKDGVAAREIERKYGLTTKSAWFMMHRIREAMRREPMAGLLRRVVVDETYIGGKPSNRHGYRPGQIKGYTEKTPVVALISRDAGEVRARAVTNVTSDHLHDPSQARSSQSSRPCTPTGTSATHGSPATTPVMRSWTTRLANTSAVT